MDEITRRGRRLFSLGVLTAAAATASAASAATFSPAGSVSPTVDMPRSVAFHPADEYLAVAGPSGPLSRYEIPQGGALVSLPPTAACAGSSVAFKPSGNVLASADAAASTVTLCSVSRIDGSVTPLGSPMPTGTTPTSVQFSPDGKFLATTDVNAGTISMFSVGATGLAPINDGEGFLVDPFITTPAMSASFSPDSRFLVVTISSCPINQTLAVWAVAADGSLSKVDETNPPMVVPNFRCAADTVFVGSGNAFLTVAVDMAAQSEMLAYALSPTGELMGPDETLPTGPAPIAVAASPDGTLVAYTSQQNDTLTLLKRANDGALTPATTITPGDGPSSVAFSADGTLLSVTNRDDDTAVLYHLAPGPALLPAGAPTPLDGEGGFLAVSPDGLVAVATHDQDGVQLLRLDAAGRLTRTAALGPTDVTAPHGVAFDSGGDLLAVTDDDGLHTYTVSAGGAPTHVDSATTGGTPYGVAFSPNDALLVVGNFWDHSLAAFSVAPDGVLTARGLLPHATRPRGLAFSPDGTLLLTANEGSDDVGVFAVSDTTLTFKRRIPAGRNPVDVAFRPTGDEFAEVSYNSHRVRTYAIDADGNGRPLDSKPVEWPAWVAYSPSGDLLAAVDETPDSSDPSELHTFSVSDGGMLTPFGDPTVTDLNPYGVAFDPTSRFMLLPDILNRAVWVYPLAAPVLDTVIDSGPAAFDSQPSPAFDFDASYPSTYECKLDDGPFAACGRTPAIPVAGDGPHTLAVRARDYVGNVDATPATHSWTRDATPPSPPAPAAPPNGAANLAPELSLSWAPSVDALSGVSGYELLVDGAVRGTVDPSACAPECTATVSGLSDGVHAWQIRATDVAGNVIQSASRTFTVDATAPWPPSPLAPAAGAVVGTAHPTLSWLAAIDGGSGVARYESSIDGQPLPPTAATSIQAPSALADGVHTWSLTVVDHAGNRSVPVSTSFRTDTTPPVAHLTAGPRRTRPGIEVTLDARASSDPGGGIAAYRWDTDGDGVLDRDTGANPMTTTTFSADDTYRLAVQVTDQAGLTGFASFDVTITPTPALKLGQGAGVRFIPPKATRSRLIRLVLTPPTGTRAARISNDDDPNEPGIKRVVFDGQAAVKTDWLLDPQTSPGKESKQVFVWFERGTELVHTSPTIILDEDAPRLRSATVARRRVTAGGRGLRITLKVRADDHHGTGIAKVRVGRRPRGRGCTGSFRPVRGRARKGAFMMTVRRRAANLHVTVRDAVGNTSSCVRARMPR